MESRIAAGETGQTLHSIGEAADLLGLSIPTLRLYEREGLVLPARKSSRHRRYTTLDLERIRCIRQTINGDKVSIAGIRRILSMIPCWKIKGCPEEARRDCAAFTEHTSPCWSLATRPDPCHTPECRQCAVYTDYADCNAIKHTIALLTTAGSPGDARQAGPAPSPAPAA